MKVVESLEVLLFVTCAVSGMAGPAAAGASPGELPFALDLYEGTHGTKGNLCLSPSSLSSTFEMTLEGARGRTRAQMAEVLRVHGQRHRPNSLSTSSGDDGRLLVANALWGQLGFEFRTSYLASIRDRYGAGFGELDFARDTEQARHTINDWTADRTGGRIDELLADGDLDSDTILVLTNAIYFGGRWAVPFDEERTVVAEFRPASGPPVSVPFMSRTDSLPFVSLARLALVELPYEGGRFAMTLLMPHDDDGLRGLEDSLTPDHLTDWLGELAPTPVRVRLPRFTLDTHVDLTGTLIAMGMTDAFTDRADLSGMSPVRGLSISKVVQRVRLEVDERGTEGAAGSGVVIKKGPRPAEFVADRPFLFLIRDRSSGHVLFMGRIVNPAN